ncbi:family 10 glycosylhydrolase [Deinococcus peraridilitoris]|uniref:Glycosyl hydrolase-like 10 domain-containing protein n=1 Tax=Deinococcus peraridilitoris (strain DSM 19664 / LMG 22246 / CIP 109416 / KR-200) TaxID=937777 RepID=L0A1H2_DEIPD|nr:family 10 glycosylhydrolase [Deinococcus peraridilitoris]AFZ67299.1 hypothetical protein Deipe_1780 [Deinococcus peraridilitoris DSM 19664]
MRILLTLALACASLAPAKMAFWLRPPTTPTELERTLAAAKAAGFTDVLLEGFYHGRTVWPSEVTSMKTSYDALEVTMKFASREGLNVSVWFETLYWRPAEKFGVPVTPLWRDEWATLSKEGWTSLQHGNLGFVDPAESGVGEVLERLVREVATRHPGAGLHLDYLRYPRESDFGYTPTQLQEFQRRTGRDARTIAQQNGDGPTPEWETWMALRRDAVTNLANRLIGAFRDAGGQGLVSAAVYGGQDPLQDWRSWRGLQVAMPMLYLPTNFASFLPFALLPFPKGEQLWPGVQIGPNYPSLAQQQATLRALGYPNIAVFDWRP